MIHWGSSLPCTLYINGEKKCDFHLPDTTLWCNFTAEVARQFGITPTRWYYTCANRSFNELLNSEEEFQNVKSACVTSQVVLQLNAMTDSEASISDTNDSNFDLSVELAVQRYLERAGPSLIQHLAHSNKLCCCQHDVSSSSVVANKNENIHDNSPQQASVFNDETVEMTDNAEVAVNRDRSRRISDGVGIDSCKRHKVVLGEKRYMMACLHDTRHVIPGQKVKASWNLITKHDDTSRWEVTEEGGTLLHVGDVQWEKSATPSTSNIYTFSAEFLAPSREGSFESVWSLLEDSRKRETFTFCKVIVSKSPLRSEGPTLAMHGNIPAETAVAKHLNSNKVFCLSKSPSEGTTEFVVVPPATLTSSTSSESSSIEIIERSTETAGFFLHDQPPAATDQHSQDSSEQSFASAPGFPPEDATFSDPTQSFSSMPHEDNSLSGVVHDINHMNISARRHVNSAPSGGAGSSSESKVLNTAPGMTSSGITSSQSGSQPRAQEQRTMSQSLELLQEMGFTDTEHNRTLLRHGNQTFEEVVLQLSEAGAAALNSEST